MKNKAQVSLEVAILIAVVAVALIAMRGYFKRSLQGNWRANIDSLSDEQYEPGVSQEQVSALRFVSPRMRADLNVDQTDEQTFNLGSGSGILRINRWGTYSNGASHE